MFEVIYLCPSGIGANCCDVYPTLWQERFMSVKYVMDMKCLFYGIIHFEFGYSGRNVRLQSGTSVSILMLWTKFTLILAFSLVNKDPSPTSSRRFESKSFKALNYIFNCILEFYVSGSLDKDSSICGTTPRCRVHIEWSTGKDNREFNLSTLGQPQN